jgi:CRP-like cAMP-binding protein
MTSSHADLLKGLLEEDAAAVRALGTHVDLAPGAVLFRLGDPAEAAYLIERGRIALTLPMRVAGQAQDVVVEERDEGQMLGWSALIPPHRFTLSATAPLATRVLAIRRSALMEFCAASPRVGYQVALNVAAIVGQRLQVVQAMWLREMQRTVNNVHA